MQPVLEGGDNAEVAASSAQGPEEIRILVLAGAYYPPVCGNNSSGQQIIDRQPMLSRKIADPAAERQSGDSCRRDDSARGRKAVLLRCAVELAPGDAALGNGTARRRIHRHRLHEGEIDHHPAFDAGASANVVTSASNGNLKAVLLRKGDGGDYVGVFAGPRDHGSAFVHHAVKQRADIVVIRIAGLKNGSRKPAPEVGKGGQGDLRLCHWFVFEQEDDCTVLWMPGTILRTQLALFAPDHGAG